MDANRANYVKWIRQKIGRRKIFLVFATVVLRDEAGAVLLQRRTDFDFWGLPGGALEIDEDIQSCARRELQEETGLTVGELQLVGVYSDPRYDVTYPNGDQVQQCTICFSATACSGEMRTDRTELRTQQFFAPDMIPWHELPLWYKDMLQHALDGGPPRFCAPYRANTVQDQIASVRTYIGDAMYIGVGAKVAIVRDDGRVLMIRRRDNNCWAFPAGFSDLGENVAYTAVREAQEETGFLTVPERIIGIYSSRNFHHTYPNGDRTKNVGILFRMQLVGGKCQVDEQEATEVAWVEPAQVVSYHGDSAFTLLYEQAVRHLDDGTFII